MNYNNVGILLTDQCTANCDSCCFECSPQKKNWLPYEKVIECIDETKDIDEINQIGFSGGEPFLNFSNLLLYVKRAKSINKMAAITTNAFWANTYDDTFEKLFELKEAGLSGIGISYDEFHKEYIDSENVINVIKASKCLNLPITIQCVITNSTSVGELLGGLGKHLVDVSLGILPLNPVGNAAIRFDESEFIKDYNCGNSYCRKSGTFAIDSFGNAWPCCSPYVFKTSLSVGNINEYSIEEIYERLRTNIILSALRNYGFDYFLDIANKIGIKYPSKIITSCELCSLFFNSSNYYKFIPYISADKTKELKKL